MGKNVKHIIADGLYTESQLAAHTLWLGLHCGSETWMTEKYPVKEVLKKLVGSDDKQEETAKKSTRGRKKNQQEEGLENI